MIACYGKGYEGKQKLTRSKANRGGLFRFRERLFEVTFKLRAEG